MKMELKSPSASESGHISEILNSQIMMFSNRFYLCLWHSESYILFSICTCGNIVRFPITIFLPSQWMEEWAKFDNIQNLNGWWIICLPVFLGQPNIAPFQSWDTNGKMSKVGAILLSASTARLARSAKRTVVEFRGSLISCWVGPYGGLYLLIGRIKSF